MLSTVSVTSGTTSFSVEAELTSSIGMIILTMVFNSELSKRSHSEKLLALTETSQGIKSRRGGGGTRAVA